jgi:hypothetical protein
LSDDGQALVEFALVLPFLLLFAVALVLIAEIGVARLALENAAAEGARIGALTNDDDEISRTVRAAVEPLEQGRVRVTVEPREHERPRSADPRGSLLRVALEYAVPVPLAFAGLPRVTVRGAAVRVIEWTP